MTSPHPSTVGSRGHSGAWGGLVVTLLLCLTVPVLVITLVTWSAPFSTYWTRPVFRSLVVWIATMAIAAWVFTRASSRWSSHLLVGAVALYVAGGVGLPQTLAALLFLASSYVVGRALIGLLFGANPNRPLVSHALAVGVTAYLSLFGLLIHFPVNSRGNYLAILALPLLLAGLQISRLQPHIRACVDTVTRLSGRLSSLPLAHLTVVLTVVGYVAMFAFFPSIGYDDNALHLRMWSVLSAQGAYEFDPVMSIWSVAPFALDLLTSVVSMVAAADSRGAVSLTLLLLLLHQLWRLGAYVVRARLDRAILVILFASTPMLANLLALQQVELLLALLATAGALLAVERRRLDAPGRAAAAWALAALCAATKLPGAVLGVTILVACFRRTWGHREERATLVAALPGLLALLPVFGFAAFHSYLVAWRSTGNPLFPLYNGYFKSPLAPAMNFSDDRYLTGFTFSSYWDVFFHTSRHFESTDFTAGFQYLLILPLGLALLALKRFRAVRWPLLVPLLGFGLTMFAATQYWRYLFPVLPLASVAMGAGLSAFPGLGSPLHVALRRGVLLCFAAINLFFLPGISWFFSVPAYRAYSEAGRSTVTRNLAPEKSLTEEVNRHAPGARVLYDSEVPAGATLIGTPIYINWYSPLREARVDSWRSAADVAAFIKAERVDLVVWNQASTVGNDSRGLLMRYLSQHGFPEHGIGSKVLYRIVDQEPTYRTLYSAGTIPPLEGGLVGSTNVTPGHGMDFTISQKPRIVATIELGRARVARLGATFRCPSGPGRFVVQINWNVGSPYLRSAHCSVEPIQISEAFPIPLTARTGEVLVTVQETAEALVSSIHVEAN